MRTCLKDEADATWSSLSSDGHSENDGTVTGAVAAENVAAVAAERRDTGGYYRSICYVVDNTRSAPMR